MAVLLPIPVQAASNEAIIVNLPSRTLEFYSSGRLVQEYRVAIGKASTPTPLGDYRIIDKEVNPAWYSPGKGYSVPSGPANPLGYRWMGFLPTYGIHGTNAPWSIGGVVSNGCIRMHEEEVEELFEWVSYGTPVHITYNRVIVKIDDDGHASLGIYPDVYGYQPVTLKQVKDELAANGLDGLASDEWLRQIIAREPDRQVPFAQVHNIKVNGNGIDRYVVSIDGVMYAPALAIADSLQTKLIWDEANSLVVGKQHSVAGLIKGDTVYVAADNLALLFGGRQEWRANENCFYMQVPVLRMEGRLVCTDVQQLGSSKAVPVLALAKALGQRLTWDADTQTVSNAVRKLPVQILGDEPYIDTNSIGEYFNAGVTWDEDGQTLDLNYETYQLDVSMYLDLMGDFI